MDTIWRPVAGYEGSYEVSDMGEVRNAAGLVLKPRSHLNGYRHVDLYKGGIASPQYVHRLVAKAFIPNTWNKQFVDHIEGVAAGDSVSNLRWATSSENNRNASISKRNSTGFKGVTFHKDSKKYRARIYINGKLVHLGSFNTAAEGHAAYCAAAAANYGEFACNG